MRHDLHSWPNCAILTTSTYRPGDYLRMALGLRFEFDGGPVAHAEMHEKYAPTSCQLLWEALLPRCRSWLPTPCTPARRS